MIGGPEELGGTSGPRYVGPGLVVSPPPRPGPTRVLPTAPGPPGPCPPTSRQPPSLSTPNVVSGLTGWAAGGTSSRLLDQLCTDETILCP